MGVAVRTVVGNHGRVHSYPQARQQAQQLADSGDLPGARAVLEHLVDLDRPRLATADPELLATMRQLAGLHVREADPAGARRLLEEAYAAGQRIGPADPLMVLLAYDLAVVAEELDNRHEARRNFALVAEYGPAALGDGHPAVTHARGHVAEGVPAESAPAEVLSPPVSSSPVFGGVPAGGATPHPRAPWVIAAAAVVFAVVMLVVVLVRPDAQPVAQPDDGTPVAGATSAPVAVEPATAAPTSTPTTSPTVTGPRADVEVTTRATEAARTTTAPARATAVASRIIRPADGSAVGRRITVAFTVSAADLAATDTLLVLSVCVAQWCFLDAPVAIKDGRAQDYTVTLGSAEGEGVGEKWRLRIDRLSPATYDYLEQHKQTAIDNGTWGKGITTPTDRLNKTPVSSVVVTKAS